jgi:hypothetical protein
LNISLIHCGNNATGTELLNGNSKNCTGKREIDENVIRSVPKNTEKSKNSVWKQLMSFCAEKSTHLIQRNIDFKYSVFLFEKYSP